VTKSLRELDTKKFMNITKCSTIKFLLGATLLGALTGCVGYVDGPRGEVYVQPPQVRVEPMVVVQDDYVYYPEYQVYYSSNRHQYRYQEGNAWVTRSSPPHVSINVLAASPSVRLGFHDDPSFHHEAVVKQYPKHGKSGEDNRGGRDEGKNGRN
jgi:hypothetical protein